MLKHLTPLSLLAVLALSAPALAQQTDTEQPSEAPADTAAPAADSASGEDQLDLGRSVDDGELAVGDRYSKQKFDDWDLACIKTEGETDPCSLLQILTDEAGNPIAEYSLFRIADGQQAVAGATIIVPLETLLPAQLTIAIDSNPGKRYGYSFCNPIGCIAQIGLTEEDVTAMKRGSTAKISLRPAPAPDQVVELEMSLKGFTAGYNEVDVVSR
ncbi:MAG: invasion-associated locus B family protein [Pseudooceanicola sp.]|jgi:invasion protein IalB|nr:invasion-associated locus B family protein [Pseudooceanicola sp.]|tara:strand:+ start:651 stop:1292 length:642 start_codon:yes stop_codon:yes gene_type:complete